MATSEENLLIELGSIRDALIAAADRAMYESKRDGVGAPVAHLV